MKPDNNLIFSLCKNEIMVYLFFSFISLWYGCRDDYKTSYHLVHYISLFRLTKLLVVIFFVDILHTRVAQIHYSDKIKNKKTEPKSTSEKSTLISQQEDCINLENDTKMMCHFLLYRYTYISVHNTDISIMIMRITLHAHFYSAVLSPHIKKFFWRQKILSVGDDK